MAKVWLYSPGKQPAGTAWSGMSTPPTKTCEVKVDGAWCAVSLNDARLLPRDTPSAGSHSMQRPRA